MADRDPPFNAKKPQQWNMYAFGAAILASMTSILMGYTVVMSGAGMYIEDDLKIDDTQLEIVTGIISIFSLLGTTLAGRMSDWIGRRYTIVFTAAVFFAGAVTTALAPSYPFLIAGRFFAGIGIGYTLVIAPMYAAEVAPASARGLLSSLPDVFINIGALVAYVANLALSGLPVHVGWRVMFAVGTVPPVFLAAGVLAMPESPRWLVMQGRIAEARQVLGRTSDTPEEAELRLSEIQEAAGGGIAGAAAPLLVKGSGAHGGWREIATPQLRRVLLAALGLQFFQQATGIDTIVYYSPRVFEKAGFRSDAMMMGATVGVGVAKTGFILIAVFLCDKVGRRPLLLTGVTGMAGSLLVLATGLLVIDRSSGEEHPWVAGMCVAAVVAFVGSFSVGMGPIAWVYTSEIFPLRLRAQGASLAAATNRIMSAVVSMTFISLYKAITVAGSFYLFAALAMVSWVFIYVCLPETRGRSLEEMQVIFGDKREDGHHRRDERKDLIC